MKIISDDGQEFADVSSCLQHEKEIAENAKRRTDLQKEKRDRLNQLKEAYRQADNLAIRFMEDYGYNPCGMSPIAILDVIGKYL